MLENRANRNGWKKYELKNYHFGLILLCLTISILGIMVIGSAKQSVQGKQVMGLVAGIILMIIFSLIDYHWILKFRWLIYFFNLILLVLVIFVGDDAGGAQRWIEIAGLRFQPSELTKILMILFFAKFFEMNQEKINTLKTILTSLALVGLVLLAILKQPDLSTSIMVALLFCMMLYGAGLSYKIILPVIGVSIPAFLIVFYMVIQEGQTLISDYQRNRIMAWLDPDNYPDLALQQTNSVIAIGSGQLWGKGLNNDSISSVKNGNYIPEPQTDFIFSVIGEELGFLGSCAVVILLLLIALECLWIAHLVSDLSGKIICIGMASLIAIQGFINIGVVTRILPNTGLPLPFISYGLTSLMSLYIGMGVVLNVGLQTEENRFVFRSLDE